MSKVYQLKIKILDVKPLIWRRVQISISTTFWELHVLLRDTLYWLGSQTHFFKLVHNKKEYFIRSFIDDYDENQFPLSWNVQMKKYLLNDKYKIYYIYGNDEDFVHEIVLEKKVPKDFTIDYPICIGGKGITDEYPEEDEPIIGKQIKSLQKFNVDDVVVTRSNYALSEHKVKLFDSLYS